MDTDGDDPNPSAEDPPACQPAARLIRKILELRVPAFAACADQGVLPASFTVGFKINVEGRVPKEDLVVPPGAGGECIQQILRRAVFPPPQHGVAMDVTAAFASTPPGGIPRQ